MIQAITDLVFLTKGSKKTTVFYSLSVLEIFLGIIFFISAISLVTFITGHFLVTGLMILVLYNRQREDMTRFIPGLLVIILSGPLGAAGFLLFSLYMNASIPSQTLLDDWYERLSSSVKQNRETRKFQKIFNGRATGTEENSVDHFYKIITGSDTRDKQVLLGIIALKYHPDYFPVLQQALRDSEPTVRVQAAAAFTKLRGHYKSVLRENMTSPESSPDNGTRNNDKSNTDKRAEKAEKITPSGQIIQLSACLESGFLEKSEKPEVRDRIKELFVLSQGALSQKREIPGNMAADILYCKLLSDENEHETVCTVLEKYLPVRNPDVQSLYIKGLLAQRQFDKLSAVVALRA